MLSPRQNYQGVITSVIYCPKSRRHAPLIEYVADPAGQPEPLIPKLVLHLSLLVYIARNVTESNEGSYMETSAGAATAAPAAGADATEPMPNAHAMTAQAESLTLNMTWQDKKIEKSCQEYNGFSNHEDAYIDILRWFRWQVFAQVSAGTICQIFGYDWNAKTHSESGVGFQRLSGRIDV